MKFFDWLERNRLVVVLSIVIVFLVYRQANPRTFNPKTLEEYDASYSTAEMEYAGQEVARMGVGSMPISDVAPSESLDRMVIRESSLSLQVQNVEESVTDIERVAEESGGFMVNSSINTPYEGATGYITIRVPESSRLMVLEKLKDMAVKVVSENVYGTDVTDQYEDIGEKLSVLQETKAKFEAILDRADDVNEILKVQQQILAVQNQIDALKGRQEYLEKTASLSLVTVSLSTDEFALPYAPDEAWRPQVVFKTAVRSLVRSVRGLADLFIWIVVYGVVLVPVIWLVRKYIVKR